MNSHQPLPPIKTISQSLPPGGVEGQFPTWAQAASSASNPQSGEIATLDRDRDVISPVEQSPSNVRHSTYNANGVRDMTTTYALDTAPPQRQNGAPQSQQRNPQMEEDLSGFWATFTAAQVLGVLVVILVAVWTGGMGGGFAWRSNPPLQFNWHPLLMTVGFIFLYGNSIMIYRALRAMRKQKLKLIHAGLPVITIICILVAQIAVFDYHNLNDPPIPNLYSLHSWIGLGAIILYIVQWVIGLVVFLYPGASVNIRTKIMSWHVLSGLVIFTLVILASITGLLEKAIFKLGTKYGELPGEAYMINFIGIFIILFAGLVVYITTNPKFKRYPRPEDGALLTKSSVSE